MIGNLRRKLFHHFTRVDRIYYACDNRGSTKRSCFRNWCKGMMIHWESWRKLTLNETICSIPLLECHILELKLDWNICPGVPALLFHMVTIFRCSDCVDYFLFNPSRLTFYPFPSCFMSQHAATLWIPYSLDSGGEDGRVRLGLTVHPWTTQIWRVRVSVHLHVDIFQ